MKPSKHYIRHIHLLCSPDHPLLQALFTNESLIMVPPPRGCDRQMLVPRAPADPKNNSEPGEEVMDDVAMPAADLQEVAQESLNLDNFQRLVLMTETVNKLQRQINSSRQAR